MKSPKLKIIHVIYSLSSGGAERVVLNLCNEQVKDHDVVLLTILNESKETNFYKNQLDSRVKFINLKSKKGLAFKNFFAVNSVLKQEKPDVVHFHLNTIVYGFIAGLRRKTKIVHTLHSVADLTLGIKGQKWINKWMYLSNRITPVALSEECASTIIQQYGIPNVQFVLNGVPEHTRQTQPTDASEYMNQFKNDKNSIVYIHVARYNRAQKNQELLFEVFNEIIAKNKNIHLVVLGRDYPDYQFPNIHLLGEVTNPLNYIEQSDAIVLSSLTEGIPMSVLEAFSCGIPVVSTPAGGMVDLLKHPELGILSEDFSKISFLSAVIEMNEKLISKTFNEKEIIHIFHDNYSVSTCSKEYLIIYQS